MENGAPKMKHAMESRDQIEETAAAWIFRRDSGDWTPTDDGQLAAWLDAATAHRTVFLRLDSAWQQAARLKAVGAGIPPGTVPSPDELRRVPFFDLKNPTPPTAAPSEPASPSRSESAADVLPRRRVPYRALAASLLLATLFAAAWYLLPDGPAYHTDIGGLAAVPMPDGSRVTLNTDSQIRVAVTETERRVNLEQGEAFFEVAKDPARPFVVAAGNQRVIAVGTKFSVRRDERGVRVVVIEGRVRVEPGSGAGAPVPPAEVSAGSVARSGGEGVLIEKKPLTEVEAYLSWRSGFLVFRETPLADAVAEFNRYNEQKIVLEDPHLAGMHIDGNFRSTNVSAFVRLLEDGFPVTIERSGNQILVRAK
jgi:transmembrane sensor